MECPYAGCKGEIKKIGDGIGVCQKCNRYSIICDKCRTVNVAYANYCRKCGRKLNWNLAEIKYVLSLSKSATGIEHIDYVKLTEKPHRIFGKYGFFWWISKNEIGMINPGKGIFVSSDTIAKLSFSKIYDTFWGDTILYNGESVRDTLWVIGIDEYGHKTGVRFSVWTEEKNEVDLGDLKSDTPNMVAPYRGSLIYFTEEGDLKFINHKKNRKENISCEIIGTPKFIYGFPNGFAGIVTDEGRMYIINSDMTCIECKEVAGKYVRGERDILLIEGSVLKSINAKCEESIVFNGIDKDAKIYTSPQWLSVGYDNGFRVKMLEPNKYELINPSNIADGYYAPPMVLGKFLVTYLLESDRTELVIYKINNKLVSFVVIEPLSYTIIEGQSHIAATLNYLAFLTKEDGQYKYQIWRLG